MWFSQILLLLLNYEEDFSPIPHLSRCMSTIAIGSFLIKPRPHLDYNTFKGCIPERQNLRTLIEIQTPKKLDICMCILMNQLHTPHATDYSLPIIIMHVQRHLRLGLHLQLMCFPPRIQESVRLIRAGHELHWSSDSALLCTDQWRNCLSSEVQRVLWVHSIANLHREHIKNNVGSDSNVAILRLDFIELFKHWSQPTLITEQK